MRCATFELRAFSEKLNGFVDLLQHALLVSAEHALQDQVVGHVIAAKDRAVEVGGIDEAVEKAAKLK